MKKTVLLIIFSVALISFETIAQQIAFPGAEGFGRFTQGGRGGKVIKVTNLNDSGEGSLRSALTAEGPRIVVFDVSGIIELESRINITNPYLTIAGQTAPGDGICLKNHTIAIYQTHDIIIRFLKIRPGANGDAIGVDFSKNVIIDHCSMSWTTDEIVNIRKSVENVTMQWCILSESLNPKKHGYAATLGGQKTSYHHNLLANNYGRNPSIGGEEWGHTCPINFTNNVIFNFGVRALDGKPHGINVINNYYKPGPASQASVIRKFLKVQDPKKKNLEGIENNFYLSGNHMEGEPDAIKNNWDYVFFNGDVNRANSDAGKAFDDGGYKLRTAKEAYKEVLGYAGAFFPKQDAIDKRILNETCKGKPTYGNGLINSAEEVGAWPEYKTYNVPNDTDKDGMPDKWEIKNDLNPNDANDANKDKNNNGYTNIEEYINGLVPLRY